MATQKKPKAQVATLGGRLIKAIGRSPYTAASIRKQEDWLAFVHHYLKAKDAASLRRFAKQPGIFKALAVEIARVIESGDNRQIADCVEAVEGAIEFLFNHTVEGCRAQTAYQRLIAARAGLDPITLTEVQQ